MATIGSLTFDLMKYLVYNERKHPYYVNDEFLNNIIKDYEELLEYYDNIDTIISRRYDGSYYDAAVSSSHNLRKKYHLDIYVPYSEVKEQVSKKIYIYFNNMSEEELMLFCKKVVDFSPENKQNYEKNSFNCYNCMKKFKLNPDIDYINYENEEVELEKFIKDQLYKINNFLENKKTEQRTKK